MSTSDTQTKTLSTRGLAGEVEHTWMSTNPCAGEGRPQGVRSRSRHCYVEQDFTNHFSNSKEGAIQLNPTIVLALNPDLERFYAKRMDAKTTEIKARHVSFLSHPGEVAKVIEEAFGATR